MKTHLKKQITAAITVVSIIASSAVISSCSADEQEHITVTLNSSVMTFDTEPEVVDGSTMVPMRAIFEALGAEVEWNEESGAITATKGKTVIVMRLGDNAVYKNGEKTTVDTAPYETDGRTLVPIRVISEMLGATVEWDEDTSTVMITEEEDSNSDEWKSNTGTIDLDTMTVSGGGRGGRDQSGGTPDQSSQSAPAADTNTTA